MLDSIIDEMGASRARAMYICLAIMSLGLIAVFIIYFRMSQSQIKMLEEAKNMAEDALVEAEVATEEATKSKENAENALAEAEAANEEAIKEKNLDFKADVHDIICETIYCDGTRLNQIMLNLLSNAVKFTPEGGSVTLDWSQEESKKGEEFVRNIIRVADTGIGMSEEFSKKIFEPFEREDNKRVHKIQGTGLGMSITKYLVDAMEGEILVDSKQGEGTTFTVIIDIKKADSADLAGSLDDAAAEDINVDNLDLTGKKILLAEDQKVNAIVASTYLKEIGAEVEIAEDGQIALDMFEKSDQFTYDAVLMDLRMPNMNGIESTKAIRALERPDAVTVPIIAMTADAFGEDIKRCLDAGMNAHISKPIDLKLLKVTLKKYLF